MVNTQNCPICRIPLTPIGSTILIKDVFEQWNASHSFSQEVIREHLDQNQTTRLYECPSCSLEIYLPQVIGSEDFYRELQEDVQFSYYRDDKWDFDEALKDIKNCSTIIEIGCGPGSFLAKAKPYLQRTCGTEYNKAALEAARRKGLEVYGLEYDISSLTSSFDAVFSFHVLEHVSDPLSFIKEISSLAKPNGKICISVPNQDGPIKNIENSIMNMPPHHATHWKLRTFEVLANKLNFRITKVAYEPLLLENQYYYSNYWLNKIISDRTVFQRKFKKVISMLMQNFFMLLRRFGLKRFVFLRGQAIYVVMEKR